MVATPSAVLAGGQLIVNDTVRAEGGSTGSFVVSYYLEPGGATSPSNTRIGSRTVGGLSAGATSSWSTPVMVPTGAAGQMRIWAVVDSASKIAESNESNNVLAGSTVAVKGAQPVAAGTALTYDAAGHLTGIFDVAGDPLNCGSVGFACSGVQACCSNGICGHVSGGLCVPGVVNVSVSVSPSEALVTNGGSLSLTATVANASNTAVTWDVNGISGGNAQLGTIDAQGRYSAPQSVASLSTVTLTATSVADWTKSGSAKVAITRAAGRLAPMVQLVEFLPSGPPPANAGPAWGAPVGGVWTYVFGSPVDPWVPGRVAVDGSILPFLCGTGAASCPWDQVTSIRIPSVFEWGSSTPNGDGGDVGMWTPAAPKTIVVETRDGTGVLRNFPVLRQAYASEHSIVLEGENLDQIEFENFEGHYQIACEHQALSTDAYLVQHTATRMALYVPGEMTDVYGRVFESEWFRVVVWSYEVGDFGHTYESEIWVPKHEPYGGSYPSEVITGKADAGDMGTFQVNPPGGGCTNTICD